MKKYRLWIIFPVLIVIVLVAYYAITNSATEETVQDPNLGTNTETIHDAQILLGSWKNSVEDDSVVEFKEDGTMIDTTQGVVAPGTWKTFTSDLPLPENVDYTFEEGKAYLTVKIDRGSRFFEISSITETNLELLSMDGNDTLVFEKVR